MVLFRRHDGPRESKANLSFSNAQWKFYQKHKYWMPSIYKFRMLIKCISLSDYKYYGLKIRILAKLLFYIDLPVIFVRKLFSITKRRMK
jgi:hypothetical protein